MRPESWKTLSRITAASLTFFKSSITEGIGILQKDSSMAGSSCQPVNGWRHVALVAVQLKYSKRLTSTGSMLNLQALAAKEAACNTLEAAVVDRKYHMLHHEKV